MASKYEWLFIGLVVGIPLGLIIYHYVTTRPAAQSRIVPVASPAASRSAVTTLSNDEDWTVVRDSHGRVANMKVVRQVHSYEK